MNSLLPAADLGRVVTCLSLIVAVWFTHSILSHRSLGIGSLPLPAGSEWIWGHEKKVFFNQPGRSFRDWALQLGVTYRIRAAFGAPDILVLADPHGITHILRNRVFDYHHSEVVRPRIGRLLGKSLGWVEGESEHRRMKQLVSPSLTADNIKKMSPDILDAAAVVLDDLENLVRSSNGRCDIDIVEWSAKATLNIVGRVSFQHDFEGGRSDDAQRILNARAAGARPIARFAGFLALMLLRRFTILNHLPIPVIQAQGSVRSVIQSGVSDEMIKRNAAVSVKDGNDLLSRLLRADIDEQELHEHISTFIIAGHETTTGTLGYAIYELARHPDAQKRLREEILSFPAHAGPTYDDLQSNSKLPYLDAVLKETLRLYPALPYMERVATKPDVVPLLHPVPLANGKQATELHIRPGQTVLIPIIAIQRQDSLWKDPDSFRPERWLSAVEGESGMMPRKEELPSGWAGTLAFSDGPRTCIGWRLAVYNFKVILSGLITRFRFEDDDGVELNLKIASSLQPWVKGREEKGPHIPVSVTLA